MAKQTSRPGHDRAHAFPVIRELTAEESRAILARHNVGRIAFSFHDRVDIEPIHYVLDEQWLYGRTGVGSKFTTLAHHPWCAFEVDEVRDLFDWDSVVVKGHMERLDPDLASPEARARALELMRTLVPATLTESDPAPTRSILFRIAIGELTGRSARSAY